MTGGSLARRLGRPLRYLVWVLSGWLGPAVRLACAEKTTALIVYHNPARVRHLKSQVRHLLRCTFVEKVVIVSHNPSLNLASQAAALGDRVMLLASPVPRGCGDRWKTARALNPDYLIVIDDDMLLFARQIARLFAHLVRSPRVLHGFSGIVHLQNNDLDYHDREDMSVDYLCEVYALSGEHLQRYSELEAELADDSGLAEMIRSEADFVVVSLAGHGRPQIHNTGHLFRCSTHKQSGVAIHQQEGFRAAVLAVSRALRGPSSIDKPGLVARSLGLSSNDVPAWSNAE